MNQFKLQYPLYSYFSKELMWDPSYYKNKDEIVNPSIFYLASTI